MTSLPSLLAQIPDEYKPVSALAIGAVILVVLVLLHGVGIHSILVMHTRRMRLLRKGRPRLWAAVLLFGWAVFLMLFLHVVGFAVWGYALIVLGVVPRAYNAIYFSANAYTTLGFGNVDLTNHWRIIAPIIGISGLFTFAWTTSALSTVVDGHSELMDRLEEEREQEYEMRSSMRKEIWNAIQKEHSAEHSEKSQTYAAEAGAPFLTRIRARRLLNSKLKQLRAARDSEILDLRHKERAEEEKLGPGDPPEKPEDESTQ